MGHLKRTRQNEAAHRGQTNPAIQFLSVCLSVGCAKGSECSEIVYDLAFSDYSVSIRRVSVKGLLQ